MTVISPSILTARLRVTETVKVFATGAQIKHEIYRDITTRYNDRFGNPYTIHFEVSPWSGTPSRRTFTCAKSRMG